MHVYLWLAHMARTEADELAYAWPQRDGWEAERDELMDAADRCASRAFGDLDRGERDRMWRAAMDAWGTP